MFWCSFLEIKCLYLGVTIEDDNVTFVRCLDQGPISVLINVQYDNLLLFP